jgi:hypothetical protein
MNRLLVACAVVLVAVGGVQAANGATTFTLLHIDNGQGQSNSNYDMSKRAREYPGDQWGNHVDWADSLLYYNYASTERVESVLGWNWTGSEQSMSLNYDGAPTSWRWDDQGGRKNGLACGDETIKVPGAPPIGVPGPGDVFHTRTYAGPRDASGQRRFNYSQRFGYYVVGTTHIDHNEQCDGEWFGMSEVTEQAIAEHFAARGYTVHRNWAYLYNYEPYHEDWGDPKHRWQNDGMSTYINLRCC